MSLNNFIKLYLKKIIDLKFIHESLAEKEFYDVVPILHSLFCSQKIKEIACGYIKNNNRIHWKMFILPQEQNPVVCLFRDSMAIGYLKYKVMYTNHTNKKLTYRIEYPYLLPNERKKGLAYSLILKTMEPLEIFLKRQNWSVYFASNHEGESDSMRKIWLKLNYRPTNCLNVFFEPILSNDPFFQYSDNNTIDAYLIDEGTILTNWINKLGKVA